MGKWYLPPTNDKRKEDEEEQARQEERRTTNKVHKAESNMRAPQKSVLGDEDSQTNNSRPTYAESNQKAIDDKTYEESNISTVRNDKYSHDRYAAAKAWEETDETQSLFMRFREMTEKYRDEQSKSDARDKVAESRSKDKQKKADITKLTDEQREILDKYIDASEASEFASFAGLGTPGMGTNNVQTFQQLNNTKESDEYRKEFMDSIGSDDEELFRLYAQYERTARNARMREEDKNIIDKSLEADNMVERGAKQAGMSIASVGLTPTAGAIAYIETLRHKLDPDPDAPVDTNSLYYRGLNMKNDIRGEIAEQKSEGKSGIVGTSLYNATGGKTGGADAFLYQTQMSMADSAVYMAMGGSVSEAFGLTGNAANAAHQMVTLPGFGVEAFSSTLQEAQDRGLSKDKAVKTATVAAVAEMVTEISPLEHFWEIAKQGGKQAVIHEVVEILKQAGLEGKEEILSELINMVADAIINGNKSEYDQQVKNLIIKGVTPEEARKVATNEQLKRIRNAGIGGSISGLAFGGGVAGIKFYGDTLNAKELFEEGNYAEFAESIDTDKSSYANDKDYNNAVSTQEYAKKLAEKQEAGKPVSSKEKRHLYQMIEQTLVDARNALENPKNENGEQSTDDVAQENRRVAPVQSDITQEETVTRMSQAKTAEELGAVYNEAKNSVHEDVRKMADNLYDTYAGKLQSEGVSPEELRQGRISEQEAYEAGREGRDIGRLNLKQKEAYDRGMNDNRKEEYALKAGDRLAATNDGTDIEVSKIVDTKEGKVETDDGQILPMSDIHFKDKGTQKLWNASLEYKNPADAQMFIESYPAGQSVELYTNIANKFYRAGQLGISSFEDVLKRNTLATKIGLGEDKARALYEAGQKQEQGTRRVDMRSAKVKKPEGKFKDVRTNKANSVDEGIIKLLNQVAKHSHLDIELTDQLSEKEKGQFIKGSSKILLNAKSDRLLETFFHEYYGEVVSAWNQEGMDEVYRLVLDYMIRKNGEDAVYEKIDQYQKVYEDIEGSKSFYEAAMEMVNDHLAEILMADPQAIHDTVENMCQEAKTGVHTNDILQRIANFINDLVEMLKDFISTHSNLPTSYKNNFDLTIDEATALRQKIYDAMDVAIDNYKSAVKSEQVESADQGEVRHSVKITLPDGREVENLSDILDFSEYKRLRDMISNGRPAFIAKNGDNVYRLDNKLVYTRGKQNFGISKIILADTLDSDEVTDILDWFTDSEIKGDWNYDEQRAIIEKICGDESIKEYTNRDFKKIQRLDYPTKRNASRSDAYHAEQQQKRANYNFELEDGESDLNTSNKQQTTQSRHSLSISNVDSDGRMLSAEQQAYFKDSKIRDDQGRLITVYHGTPYGGFTVFKNDLNYFTPSQEYAERYHSPSASSIRGKYDPATNEMTYKGYLNITHPFDITDPETRNLFINDYVKGGWSASINPGLSDAEIEARIRDGIDWTEADNIKDFIDENELDYDGIILDEGAGGGYGQEVVDHGISYVTFNSNQFKNADNRNPSKNEDIRYSLSIDSEGRELSKGQQAYFKDSKVLDENGNLKVVYHGTGANFTVFDIEEARDTEDIEGFFFSGNREEASGYGKPGKYYLNITNPADYDTAYDLFFASDTSRSGTGRRTREALIEKGYDGVIAYDEDSPEYTEYIAFYPEQIKRTDNENPTEDPDIRYSLSIGDETYEISGDGKNATNENGREIPVIKLDGITLGNKKVNAAAQSKVREILKELRGKTTYIKSDNRKVFFDKKFEKEYAMSRSTFNLGKAERTAKYNAATRMVEIISNAQNPRWNEDVDNKHGASARRGWTYYDVEFIANVESGGYADVTGRLCVRMSEDGRDVVYDVDSIKIEPVSTSTTSPWKRTLSNSSISSDNQNATPNPNDVSHSLSIDSEGRELSDEQQEFFKDSKIRDAEGRLRVVYHGTNNTEFNVFDPDYIGSASGDDGFFGRGFYFAYYPGEASYYGSRRIIPAYLNITKPFNFDTELHEYKGEVARYGYAPDAVAFMNFAEKFPEIANDMTISIARPGSYDMEDIGLIEFANAFKNVINNKEFEYQTIKNEYGEDETLVLADPKEETYEYNGKTHTYISYGFQKRFYNDAPHLDVAYAYLNSNVYSYVNMYNFTRAILDNNEEFTETLKSRGYDGVIQSEGGDEAVAFYPEQIKRTDNLNPSEDPDIRYSLSGIDTDILSGPIKYSIGDDILDDLFNGTIEEVTFADEDPGSAESYRRNIDTTVANLSRMLEAANAPLRGHSVDYQRIGKIADRIKDEYNSHISKQVLTNNLTTVFDYLQNNENIDYDDITRLLTEIAAPVLEKTGVEVPEAYQHFKQYVRTIPIKLSEQQKQELAYTYGSYDSARKQNFGRINFSDEGTPIDRIWPELVRESAGLLDETANAGDMAHMLIDAVENCDHGYSELEMERGQNMAEASIDLAIDIMEEYYKAEADAIRSEAVNGVLESGMAGEAARESIDKARTQMKRQQEEFRKKTKEEYDARIKELEREAGQVDYYKAMADYNETVRKVEGQKSKAEIHRLMVELANTRRDLALKTKALQKDSVMNYKQRQDAAKTRKEITRIGNDLMKRILEPTSKKHVPTDLQKPLAEFLSGIDFVSHRSKEDSKNTKTWRERMQTLSIYLSQLEEGRIEDDLGLQAVLDPDLNADIRDFIKDTEGYARVSQLDAKHLKDLLGILKRLQVAINKSDTLYLNNTYKKVSDLAVATRNELEKKKTLRPMFTMQGIAYNTANISMLDPTSYFEEMGEAPKSVFKTFRNGFDQRAWHLKEAQEYMKKVLEGISQKDLAQWSRDKYTFNVSDGEITLTITQIMSLYELMKRDQAREHIMRGGIKADVREEGRWLKKSYTQNKPVHITPENFLAIIGKLTDEQKAVADAMQRFMATQCAEWGNHTTEQMYGYKKFTEKNYFPIKTDKNTIAANDKNTGDNGSLYHLRNLGMTKDLTPHAKNAIVLSDIFNVFSDHVADMATYDGMVMPLSDAMRWFNFKVTSEIMDEAAEFGSINDMWSIQEEIERVLGTPGKAYFTNLIKDINGMTPKAYDTQLADKLISNYKSAAVGANVRVIVQQPTAILRAANEMSPKYLARVLNPVTIAQSGKLAQKAKDNSAIAWWKGQGYFETSIGQSMRQMITGEATMGETIREYANKGAQVADDLTWGLIWRATELEIKDKRPELEYGSKEFNEAVTERFNDIVDRTQVVDTVLHRTQLMRSKSDINKLEMAFMAEPMKSYNMLHRAWKSGNKKTLARAATTFVLTNILTAAAAAIVDAFRKDDDETPWLDRYLTALKENIIDNLNPLNMFPYLKDVSSAMQGFENGRMDIEGINNLVQSLGQLEKFVKGESKKTPYGMLKSLSKGISQLSGIPAYSLIRTFESIYNTFFDNLQTTVTSDYSYAYTAIDKNGDIEGEIQKLIDKGKNPDSIAAALTKHYKNEYIALPEEERQEMKEKLLKAYEAAGKDYEKNIDKWVTSADKTEEPTSKNNSQDDSQNEEVAPVQEEYTSDYAGVYDAIDKGGNIQAEVQSMLDSGKQKSGVKSAITRHYKDDYLAASGSEKANMKNTLIKAYTAAGYTREEAISTIEGW